MWSLLHCKAEYFIRNPIFAGCGPISYSVYTFASSITIRIVCFCFIFMLVYCHDPLLSLPTNCNFSPNIFSDFMNSEPMIIDQFFYSHYIVWFWFGFDKLKFYLHFADSCVHLVPVIFWHDCWKLIVYWSWLYNWVLTNKACSLLVPPLWSIDWCEDVLCVINCNDLYFEQSSQLVAFGIIL